MYRSLRRKRSVGIEQVILYSRIACITATCRHYCTKCHIQKSLTSFEVGDFLINIKGLYFCFTQMSLLVS